MLITCRYSAMERLTLRSMVSEDEEETSRNQGLFKLKVLTKTRHDFLQELQALGNRTVMETKGPVARDSNCDLGVLHGTVKRSGNQANKAKNRGQCASERYIKHMKEFESMRREGGRMRMGRQGWEFKQNGTRQSHAWNAPHRANT